MNYKVTRFKSANDKRPVKFGESGISLDKNGELLILDTDGRKVKDFGERCKVEWMAAKGMMITGFIHTGQAKNGAKKYEYAEWFAAYITEEK